MLIGQCCACGECGKPFSFRKNKHRKDLQRAPINRRPHCPIRYRNMSVMPIVRRSANTAGDRSAPVTSFCSDTSFLQRTERRGLSECEC